jgi:O-antigen/teichoic acid export membrane protein
VNFKSNRQVPLASVAAPMLVILIVQPLALQSDRLILGWRAPTEALADYAMATQLYLPALAVLSTGAASMWPRFAQTVNDPGLTRQLFRKDSLFLLMIATAMGIALIVAGPAICTVVSDGSIVPDRTLFGAFGILLLAQAVALPSAMMMTDGSGMLFQAAALTIMMLLKLSLTLTIAGTSSAGPVLASAIAILTCQYAPSRIFVGRTRLAEGQVRR